MATLIHIWVDWLQAPGESSVVLGDPGVPRVVILRNATQTQRDHRIIHGRNFGVQPQAIMGSGIVE